MSFRFEGKNVTRALAMPAAGEGRVLEIANAAMDVLSKHAKKSPDVLQSRIFGCLFLSDSQSFWFSLFFSRLTAHSFSAEGSGVVERSITKFLVANVEPEWGDKAEVPAPAAASKKTGALDRFASSNAERQRCY